MRADFPVTLRRLITMRAHTAGDGFQSVGKIIARGDGVNHQSDQ